MAMAYANLGPYPRCLRQMNCQASFVFWFIRALVGTIFLAALTLVSSSCQLPSARGCCDGAFLLRRTRSLRTEITYIGIFLHRERRRNWVDPRLRLNTLASTEMLLFWAALTKAHCFARQESKLLRYTEPCAAQRRSSFYRMITTILTMTKQLMKP